MIWSFFDDLKPKKNEVWDSDLHHMETVGNWTSADLKGTELCGIWFWEVTQTAPDYGKHMLISEPKL